MNDFYLTPRGDLAIENIAAKSNQLQLSFVTSKSNALCLNFYLDDTSFNQISKNSLSINFSIDTPAYDKEVRIISGDECIEQAIKIRLCSALGSIRGNTDIGSTLELLKHELIDNPNIVNSLKNAIATSIKDIIVNPTIIINTPQSKYVNYSTGFNVVIIDSDKQYSVTF